MNIVRLDRFTAPAVVRGALLARIAETRALLRRQRGFVRDALLERPLGQDVVEVVTYAEWTDTAAVTGARDAVVAAQRRAGFDRTAFLAAHGITADFATLSRLPDDSS